MKDLCPSELKETKPEKRHIPVVYNGFNYNYGELRSTAICKFCVGIHRMGIFLLARYSQLTLICLTGKID